MRIPYGFPPSWTKTIWDSTATKTCCVDITATYRSLPSNISTPIQHHRNCRVWMWCRKGNFEALPIKLWAVWRGERLTEKESWSARDEIRSTTRGPTDNKGHCGIYWENRAFQARSEMITETTCRRNYNRECWPLKRIYRRLVLLTVYVYVTIAVVLYATINKNATTKKMYLQLIMCQLKFERTSSLAIFIFLYTIPLYEVLP